MLLEFACSNHKSIRSEVVFSAVAGTDTTYEDKIKVIDGTRVLKSAVVYGANGSGKSNFIDAISFVKNLVMGSISNPPGQGIRQMPHKLDGFDKDSTYRIQFITNDVRYVFGFTLKNMVVVDEYLFKMVKSIKFVNINMRRIFRANVPVIKPITLYLIGC